MPALPEINTPFLLDFLAKLLNTPNPTGLAEPAIALTEETLKAFSGPSTGSRQALKFSRTYESS